MEDNKRNDQNEGLEMKRNESKRIQMNQNEANGSLPFVPKSTKIKKCKKSKKVNFQNSSFLKALEDSKKTPVFYLINKKLGILRNLLLF